MSKSYEFLEEQCGNCEGQLIRVTNDDDGEEIGIYCERCDPEYGML